MAEIQLSPELFQDIHQAVAKQHPDADNGVVLQYLAAVSGYLLGSERNMDKATKDRVLSELNGFAAEVLDDLHQHQQGQQAPQPAQTPPATAQAFGYWNPPKD